MMNILPEAVKIGDNQRGFLLQNVLPGKEQII